MKEHGSFSVHCPDATTNIIAGIMPLAAMHDEELKIAIGSDVAGGHSIAIYKQIARAVQLSKLKEFYEPDQSKTITLTQAFYHATKEAGSVFGKVGSFERDISLMLWLLILWKIHGYRLQQKSVWSDSVI